MLQGFNSSAKDGPEFMRRLVASRYGLEGIAVTPPSLHATEGGLGGGGESTLFLHLFLFKHASLFCA
jgi:hypothetical protein